MPAETGAVRLGRDGISDGGRSNFALPGVSTVGKKGTRLRKQNAAEVEWGVNTVRANHCNTDIRITVSSFRTSRQAWPIFIPSFPCSQTKRWDANIRITPS